MGESPASGPAYLLQKPRFTVLQLIHQIIQSIVQPNKWYNDLRHYHAASAALKTVLGNKTTRVTARGQSQKLPDRFPMRTNTVAASPLQKKKRRDPLVDICCLVGVSAHS